jgi:DNA-binding Lrp family transcriptional regulator
MLRLGVQWRDAGGWFTLKFETIGRELGCSYNTVNNHVQALKVDGWIERQGDITSARRNGMPVGFTRFTDMVLARAWPRAACATASVCL